VIRLRGYRGQPLVALTLLLGGWVALRAMAWDAGMTPAEAQPFAPIPFEGHESSERIAGLIGGARLTGGAGLTVAALSEPGRMPVARFADLSRLGAAPARQPTGRAAFPQAAPRRRLEALEPVAGWQLPPGSTRVRSARLAQVDPAAAAPFHPVGSEPVQRAKRWSGDAWFLARPGGAALLGTGISPATYGASQAGGVLRYRIAPQSRHRPAAYVRTTAALNGSDEQEAAIGMSARPLPAVPVVAAAELRATRQQGVMRLRPAAMIVTELAPIKLPLAARAEAYGQAGYVGGRFATAFADGQVRVDRGVMRLGKGELRAGAGVWGGAQKGASRLDVGPTAAMALGIGKGRNARLAVDWRIRVHGNAAPDTGPAMTLSAGF